MAHQATGQAIRLARMTRVRNSLEISTTIFDTEAPNTFRMPISLVRCAAAKADKPNIPRQAISTEIRVKTVKIFPGGFHFDTVY